MYDRFKLKSEKEINEIQKKLAIIDQASSNLKKCLNIVVEYCKNPLEYWETASIGDRMIFQNLLFPHGILYDRKTDKVLTTRIHSLFSPIPELTGEMRGKKNGESIISDAFPVRVTSLGFKPKTSTAVMWCSIQLSYEALLRVQRLCLSFSAGTKIAAFFVSASYFKKLFNLCRDSSV